MRLALVLLLITAPALAQEDDQGGRPQIFVDSDTVAMRLALAKTLEKDQDWRGLFRLFQELLERYPDRVWEVEPGRYVGIRQEILRRLRAYPDEARQMYREMETPDAAVLWERFREKGDDALLQQLADRYSFTRYGEEAARLLAARAHERGDTGRALSLWTQLLADQVGTPEERARMLLRTALLAQQAGLSDRVEWVVSHMTPDLAAIPVRVGDREQPLSEAIAGVGAAAPAPSPTALTDWPSPGGSPTNDRVGSGDGVGDVVAWTWPKSFEALPDAAQPPANVAFAPAIVGGVLYHSDGRTVVALEVQSGKLLWKSASGRIDPGEGFLAHLARFSSANVEATLGCTVHNGVVYANLVTPGDMSGNVHGSSFIAAYDACTGKARFTPTKAAIPAEGVITCPPLVRDERIYAPILQPGNVNEPSVYLGCWSARTGQALWAKPTFLCGTTRFAMDAHWETSSPCPAPSLAAGAGRIYVQTNLGGVAAVNESNGEIVWITDTYRLMKRAPRLRGSRPAEVMSLPVLIGDTLWIVPRDAEMLLALDAATGAPKEASREVEGVHTLMGAIGGRLVALAERRGKEILLSLSPDPTQKEQRSVPMVPPLAGRGFLTSEFVYVPSKARLYRFDTKTWKLTRSTADEDNAWVPRDAAGHVLVHGDTLISIGRRIQALCSQDAYRARFRREFESGSPDIWIDRGLNFRRAGLLADAMLDLEHALTLCRVPGTRIESPEAREVRAALSDLYFEWGQKEETSGNRALAAGAYAWAIRRQDDPARRMKPILALAAVHEKEGRFRHVVELLARALADGADGMATPEPRFRVRWGDLLARRLTEIRVKEGDAPFAVLGPEEAAAVRAAEAREASIAEADVAPPPEAKAPPVPSSPVAIATIQLPAGTIDDSSESSALPAITPIRVVGGLADPIELRNYGGHVEARRPGADEVLWTVPDNRGWLGVVMTDRTPDRAVQLTQVLPGEPAHRAGLREGDLVESVDGIPVEGADHLIQLIAVRPERKAVFGVRREGEELLIPMTTGVRGLKRGERVERAVATPAGRLLLRRARRVQAVDAASGRIVWEFPLPEHDDGAEGRVSGIVELCSNLGRAYVLGVTDGGGQPDETWGRVACLEEATGRLLWSRDLPGRTETIFPIGSTLVGVTAATGEITVLDARTGARFGEPLAAMVLSKGGVAAAASGRLLYLVTSSGALKALDPARAAEVWAVQLADLAGGTLCDMAVGEGIVAIARTGQGIEAFDARTGERRGGAKSAGEGGLAFLTVGPGPLVVASSPVADGWRLTALDLAKGPEANWQIQFAGAREMVVAHVQEDVIFVRATMNPDQVAAGSPSSLVCAVDRATGKRGWEHAVPDGRTAPRVSAQGGRLCVSIDDKMFLFGK